MTLSQIYEGESSSARENSLIGKFELSDIPIQPSGVTRIEVVCVSAPVVGACC